MSLPTEPWNDPAHACTEECGCWIRSPSTHPSWVILGRPPTRANIDWFRRVRAAGGFVPDHMVPYL